MYLYPMYFTDELIDAIAASRKIVPYLDMPLQHINDTMLRRMQRRVIARRDRRTARQAAAADPNLVMRTTFITGFPGETDEQFEELVDFVRAQRFERLGVFTYSFEPDTPAARLPDHLPEEVKEARRERLMAVQQEIAFEWNEAQIGRQFDVLIDRAGAGREERLDRPQLRRRPGRRRRGLRHGQNLRPGQLCRCEIVATSDYDLVGVAVGKPR